MDLHLSEWCLWHITLYSIKHQFNDFSQQPASTCTRFVQFCVAGGNDLARFSSDVISDVRMSEYKGDDLGRGGTPGGSYQPRPALAIMTFSHSISALTTEVVP